MSKEKGFQTKYSPEFKLSVMDMRENRISYGATESRNQPLDKSVEEDLMAEKQELKERVLLL